MSFQSGRVGFCRFRVTGDAPTAVDEAALSILKEHKFQESDIGAPEEIESGFITGEHLFDTQFSYEKNGFGPGSNMMLFAVRIDTHKVPADVKQAYRKINEQAAAAGNPSGFASKGQKREAADLAGRQIHEDLASGKFRKSKIVPVLWDLSRRTMYCAATGNAIVEEITRLFRRSFSVDIELLSAGRLAGEFFSSTGRTRDWEDLHPSPFTAPPAEAHDDFEDADGPRDSAIPAVPWCAQGVDLKDFLGNEWLIWLWWRAEAMEGAVPVRAADGRAGEAFITIDKALDMDCAWGVRGKQTLRGEGPTRLSEAGEALANGKWPRKVGLILSDGEHQWDLTLQADRALVSSAALPEITEAQSPRELVEARLDLLRALADTLDGMYTTFLAERSSGKWAGTRASIKQWIIDRRKKRSSAAAPAPAPAPMPAAAAV